MKIVKHSTKVVLYKPSGKYYDEVVYPTIEVNPPMEGSDTYNYFEDHIQRICDLVQDQFGDYYNYSVIINVTTEDGITSEWYNRLKLREVLLTSNSNFPQFEVIHKFTSHLDIISILGITGQLDERQIKPEMLSELNRYKSERPTEFDFATVDNYDRSVKFWKKVK